MRTLRNLVVLLLLAAAALAAFFEFAPQQATDAALSLERFRAGLTRRDITLKSGLRFAYLEGGDGPTLVLLHGFAADKDNFTRISSTLTGHYHVIIPDLIGFGESSHLPAPADYRADAQARRLHEFLEALRVRGLDLGGSSMGGQIAMAFAARYPNEVSSLWLLDPAGVWSAPKSELADMVVGQGRNPLIPTTEQEYADLFGFVMADPPWIPRPMKNAMARERLQNVELSRHIFGQIAVDSVEDRVRGLKVPTLIVWGQRDRALNPLTSTVLQKLLPRSEVILMPGVGHLPMVERPQQAAADYIAFRERLAAPKQ